MVAGLARCSRFRVVAICRAMLASPNTSDGDPLGMLVAPRLNDQEGFAQSRGKWKTAGSLCSLAVRFLLHVGR